MRVILKTGCFIQFGSPIKINGRRRVILTLLDETVPENENKKMLQAKAWREFFDAVNASGEEIPETFERISFTREVDISRLII
jgi:hypothetical protein